MNDNGSFLREPKRRETEARKQPTSASEVESRTGELDSKRIDLQLPAARV